MRVTIIICNFKFDNRITVKLTLSKNFHVANAPRCVVPNSGQRLLDRRFFFFCEAVNTGIKAVYIED